MTNLSEYLQRVFDSPVFTPPAKRTVSQLHLELVLLALCPPSQCCITCHNDKPQLQVAIDAFIAQKPLYITWMNCATARVHREELWAQQQVALAMGQMVIVDKFGNVM